MNGASCNYSNVKFVDFDSYVLSTFYVGPTSNMYIFVGYGDGFK
jgi:hypothetical protein